ncbi:MAG: hypothetical protein M1285_02880 [Candidatus Thermoplasmatota archaeon]|nr:hypothetical protein [Candidatus Thermoplasmatota archaeon]
MEIIKRKSVAEKETINTDGDMRAIQVSYNSDGHIMMRFYNPMSDDNEDLLIVLDSNESRLLRAFLNQLIR